jgi:hypothetical protein
VITIDSDSDDDVLAVSANSPAAPICIPADAILAFCVCFSCAPSRRHSLLHPSLFPPPSSHAYGHFPNRIRDSIERRSLQHQVAGSAEFLPNHKTPPRHVAALSLARVSPFSHTILPLHRSHTQPHARSPPLRAPFTPSSREFVHVDG